MTGKVLMATALFAAVAYGADEKPADAVKCGDDYTPVEVSLLPGVELPWWHQDVAGFRLDLLAGRSRSVSYFDLGALVNLVDDNASGLQICGLYNHIGRGSGIAQIAGLVNRIDQDAAGLQLSAIYNATRGQFKGLACSVMNYSEELRGVQIGVFNNSSKCDGFQLGIVNYADNGDGGVQLGVINIMPTSDYPVTIICNSGFWHRY